MSDKRVIAAGRIGGFKAMVTASEMPAENLDKLIKLCCPCGGTAEVLGREFVELSHRRAIIWCDECVRGL
jgi:hypothetical protein